MELDLKEVQTLQQIADYAESLAYEIGLGTVDDVKPNGELIADFAFHCAEVAVAHERRKAAKTLDSLGIDSNKVKKLELIIEISKKNGKNIDLKTLLNRMIESEFNQTVSINRMDKKEVIKDSSINISGSAKIRINHFIDMVKEHNSKSDNKLMLSQTLLSKGIDGSGKRVINLEKIFASDKSSFAKGCGSHRNAIKEVVLDSNNFDKYNATISDLTPRANNMKSIKALEI